MSFLRRFRPEPYSVIVLLLMAGYLWLFADLAVDLHRGMRTHKADLGQIDQAVWNSSRGHWLEQTDNGYIATRMTDHVEPILVFISPVFWLWDDVRALLWLQTLFVVAGAWPLYVLSRRQFDKFLAPAQRTQVWEAEPVRAQTRPLALALVVAFLLAPQLQSALLTEFHAAPLAVPLILWAFWAVDARRWRQFTVAALLTAAVKEEMALLAAGLGAWALWRNWLDMRTAGRNPGGSRPADATKGKPVDRPPWYLRRVGPTSATAGYAAGALVFVLSFAWFVMATFVIVPAHAATVYGVAESGYFQRYGALGDSPTDIFRSFFTQPQVVWQIATEPARVQYVLGLLAPFGFLALLAPEILLLSLPLLLANLLSAYPAQYYGEFHYSAPLVAYVGAAAAYGTGRLWRWIARRTAQSSGSFQHMPAAGAGTMAVASLFTNARTALRPILTWLLVVWIVAWALASYRVHGRGPLAARYDPTPITAHHARLADLVAQIPRDAAVTATAAVHPHVSHRRYVYQFPMGLDADGRELGNADWALLDVTTNTDLAPGDLKTRVDAMLAADWGVVDGVDGFLLLRKGAPEKTIPAGFFDFARTPAAADVATFAERGLELLAVEIEDRPRWRQTKITGVWRVGIAFDPTRDLPRLDIVTPAGEAVGSVLTPTPPALVWYPPAQWQPGDVIRVTSLPSYLPRTFGLVTDNATAADIRTGATKGADGSTLVAAWERVDDRLAALPTNANAVAEFATHAPEAVTTATFHHPRGGTITVDAWVEENRIWPAKDVDVLLNWRGAEAWPADADLFVHLRRDETNLAQNDGRPRYFVGYDATGELAAPAGVVDWRRLRVPPEELRPGNYRVVIGLYNPQTGARWDVLGADGALQGQELIVATLTVGAPPAPDQSCALIPETCGAQ